MPRLALLHSINHLVSAPTSLDKAINRAQAHSHRDTDECMRDIPRALSMIFNEL
jgi:hypothetical protein